MKKTFASLCVPIIIGLSSCIPQSPIETDQIANFEALWTVIDERYCFLEEKDVDWDMIHTTYLNKLKEEEYSALGFFNLMSEMLDELKDGHVNLYSDFDISAYPIAPDPTTGLNIYARSRHLRGRLMISGGMRYGVYQTKDKGVTFGYISYGSFSNSLGNMKVILSIFNAAKVDAIILDLRGNGGGSLDNCEELLSYFIKDKTLIGYTVHKIGPGRSSFSKPKAHYISPSSKGSMTDEPVILLQDRSCYSAANDFIYKVKIAPNVVCIGEKTGGGAGMPATAELPNGWKIRYSAVKSYDKDMKLLEGGIEPDIEVHNESYYKKPDAVDQILITAIKKVYELKGVPYPNE